MLLSKYLFYAKNTWSAGLFLRKIEIMSKDLDLDDVFVSPALEAKLADHDAETVFSEENFNNFPEDYGASFRLTPQHVELLRQVRLSWDDVENGAPMVSADHPFGQEDPFEAMRSLFGAETIEAQAKAYGQMHHALNRFLRTAQLKPGPYSLRNVTPEQLLDALDGFFRNSELVTSAADIGIDPEGRVLVDADMLKLIREIPFTWPWAEDMQDNAELGEWPAPLASGKRPYAQSTWHETDMFEILTGAPPEEDETGRPVLPEGEERKLTLAHFRTLPVMQVFFENAEPVYPT